jgi:DNA repair ATPase RecN
MRELTASDRDPLIKLASSLPKGDETRKAILAGLSQKIAAMSDEDSKKLKGLQKDMAEILAKARVICMTSNNWASDVKFPFQSLEKALKKFSEFI